MKNEKILVVKTDTFKMLLKNTPFGLIQYPEDEIIKLILQKGKYLPRLEMEDDRDYKQIIPYILLKFQNKYFCTKRTENGNEKRLYNQYSLGIGGHINPSKNKILNAIYDGIEKEMYEELHTPKINVLRCQFQGILNDISKAVSYVHLGLFYVLEITELEYISISVKETDKLIGEWRGAEQLSNIMNKLEGWSKIILTDWIFKNEMI